MNPLFAGGAALLTLMLAMGRKASAAELAEGDIKKHKKESPRGWLVPFRTTMVVVRHADPANPKSKDVLNIIVEDKLEDLARRASGKLGYDVTPEEFLLATLMASEAGSDPDIAKVAIGHAALTEVWRKNHRAKNQKTTLRSLLMRGGKMGGQKDGRYAATGQPPSAHDVELAKAIFSGEIQNPVPGAVKWDDPKSQQILFERGDYSHDSSYVSDQRNAEGLKAAYLPNVDPHRLRLWKIST